MSDTTVTVSRAAEKPLPPPPPGSVWERIEWARQQEKLKYMPFSLLANRSPAQYRNIGTRGWGGRHEVVESFIRAVVKLGYSEVWVRVGQGEPKPGAREAAKKASRERRDRRQEAIDRLVHDEDLPEDDAERLVDEVGDKPSSKEIFEEALEDWDLEQWRKKRDAEREARRARERAPTPPPDPPSVDSIGQPRKLRGGRRQ